MFGFAFSVSWYLSLALMAIGGLGQTGRMALGNTLLQYYVEDNYRGRVMSIHYDGFWLYQLRGVRRGPHGRGIGRPMVTWRHCLDPYLSISLHAGFFTQHSKP